mgnify:CR=1 FL=1
MVHDYSATSEQKKVVRELHITELNIYTWIQRVARLGSHWWSFNQQRSRQKLALLAVAEEEGSEQNLQISSRLAWANTSNILASYHTAVDDKWPALLCLRFVATQHSPERRPAGLVFWKRLASGCPLAAYCHCSFNWPIALATANNE